MATTYSDKDHFRKLAESQIALAIANGARRAYATADHRIVIVEHPDGTTERIRLPDQRAH